MVRSVSLPCFFAARSGLTSARDPDIRGLQMRTLCLAGIFSVVLPFAAIETASAAGIVSYNGGRSIRIAASDSLVKPVGIGRKDRGFRFFAPNVVSAAAPSNTGTAVFGGTLTLSGGLNKRGPELLAGRLQPSRLTFR